MRKRRGFTLIELLVVVAIIAILSAVGISTFAGAQKKARDARRRADLKAIQSALEQYYIDNNVYPDTMALALRKISGGVAPVDPRSRAAYIGWTDAALTTTAYTVCADLETVGAAAWAGTVSDVCVRQLQ